MTTGIALVDMTAEGGGSAGSDVAQHSFLGRRGLVRPAVLAFVRTHDVGDLETRPTGRTLDHGGSAEDGCFRCPQQIEGALRAADHVDADMGVALGHANRFVSEQGLDHRDVRAAFDEVGGEAVA